MVSHLTRPNSSPEKDTTASFSIVQQIHPTHSERDSWTPPLETLEIKASQLVVTLLKEGLHGEALRPLRSIIPFISPYAQEELDKTAGSKIKEVY